MTQHQRRRRHGSRGTAALIRALATSCAVAALAGWGAAGATAATAPGQPPDILTAPTLVAHTTAGDVGYREVGRGSPLLLIMGANGTMDDWPPAFVDDLAASHTVVVFDNAGVGLTSAVGPSITAMTRQVSALITALRLGRPAVLGWSMGGMIAQALAVTHPYQVSRLVLAATQAGNGKSLPVPPAAMAAAASSDPATVLSVLFPPDQTAAILAYVAAIAQYPDRYAVSAASKAVQSAAILQWLAGQDPEGHLLGAIRVPTLVADGTQDDLNPVANDRLLARSIPGAGLILYPDAGHAFLFQDASAYIPAVERFLSQRPGWNYARPRPAR